MRFISQSFPLSTNAGEKKKTRTFFLLDKSPKQDKIIKCRVVVRITTPIKIAIYLFKCNYLSFYSRQIALKQF